MILIIHEIEDNNNNDYVKDGEVKMVTIVKVILITQKFDTLMSLMMMAVTLMIMTNAIVTMNEDTAKPTMIKC